MKGTVTMSNLIVGGLCLVIIIIVSLVAQGMDPDDRD